MTDSWKFWNGRIFDTWKVISSLLFIKEFKGIDKLGFDFEDMVALLYTIFDYEKRIIILKALQNDELAITPVFPPPFFGSKLVKKAFYKIIQPKYLKKFWLTMKEESFMVDVTDANISHFVFATFTILQLRKEAD